MKHRTLKHDFYLLVVKVVGFTILSTVVAYVLLILFIFSDTAKSTDYYAKYFDTIEKLVRDQGDAIMGGRLPDLSSMSNQLQAEVLDLSGNHLYGDIIINGSEFDLWKNLNKEIVRSSYVYRYIPIMQDKTLQGIYLLKAPFGYVLNNYKDHPLSVTLYVFLILSPVLFFIVYLVLFTKQLYRRMSQNISLFLQGAEDIATGNLNVALAEMNGKEFNVIRESFNAMVTSLKEAITNLHMMEKERSMMVQSIAHDIRTPITVIKGQVELMEQLLDSKMCIKKHFETIKSSCNKMVNLTNNLVILYKVEKVDFALHDEPVKLEQMLLDKKREFTAMAHLKGLTIRFSIHLSKPIFMLDESMLVRVLDNVLYNSLRFTRTGEIRLEVHDEPLNSSVSKICFRCTDTGEGFKQEDTTALFDAMYQEAYYKDHFGLGLYIAKRIVTNFGGEIKAWNAPHGGAVVDFYIIEPSDNSGIAPEV
ncbi:HAMP domain-containing sensor histidine kinase [Paenibacillus pinihumi]|uniref:HAMP domain-containing sensor histidine kinase n=1 Tax=Paenibacillus pinihumi TaxID=669462 RepID=UPI00041E2A53|nr:HAMP domain-containing sensor histidine kinase [Paenibacillus pinihumi]